VLLWFWRISSFSTKSNLLGIWNLQFFVLVSFFKSSTIYKQSKNSFRHSNFTTWIEEIIFIHNNQCIYIWSKLQARKFFVVKKSTITKKLREIKKFYLYNNSASVTYSMQKTEQFYGTTSTRISLNVVSEEKPALKFPSSYTIFIQSTRKCVSPLKFHSSLNLRSTFARYLQIQKAFHGKIMKLVASRKKYNRKSTRRSPSVRNFLVICSTALFPLYALQYSLASQPPVRKFRNAKGKFCVRPDR